MSSEVAPNLSYHYWGLGIIGEGLDGEADPKVMVRGSEFQPDKEINNEDDEGHMGTATTKISSYRTSATSAPSFTDKTRYKEGWEDIWYLLLGSADLSTGEIRKVKKVDGVNEFTFAVNSSKPQDPVFATLYNGFAKTENDAFKYEDALLGEFELSGSNTEASTYKVTFNSNFPKFRQQNPARVFPKKTIFTKPGGVSIYIAPKGEYESIEDIAQYKYPCFLDYSVSVNRNLESEPCSSNDFGTSTKVQGNLEATINITLPWTSATKHLEYTFMGGDAESTEVTDENDEKTVWIVLENGKIGSTSYNYQTIIKIPEIVLTNVDSPQSGSEAKQLELEGNIEENGVDSFIEAVITTDLEDLHIHKPATATP